MRKFLDLMGPGTLGIDGEALTFKRFHAVVRSGETAMAGDSCLMGCVAVNWMEDLATWSHHRKAQENRLETRKKIHQMKCPKIDIPGSSKCVKFLPFHLPKAEILHTWKIQVWLGSSNSILPHSSPTLISSNQMAMSQATTTCPTTTTPMLAMLLAPKNAVSFFFWETQNLHSPKLT